MAQVKFRVGRGQTCPCLILRDDGKYHCTLIEKDSDAQRVMLDGYCSHPKAKHHPIWNAHSVVKEFFPDADDETIDFILSEGTGFPCFWNYGVDGWTDEECCRTQVARVKAEGIPPL